MHATKSLDPINLNSDQFQIKINLIEYKNF